MEWPPRIETRRLILRELTDQDVDFIYAHFSDEDVCRFLFDEEPVRSAEEAMGIINWYKDAGSKDHFRWGLELKENGHLIGTCGFHFLDRKNNEAEIGYDLSRQYWRQGFMHEALGAILDIAFSHMKLNRIQAFVYTGNEGSCRLLEKLMFTQEGIARDKNLFRGRYYDHYCYSLLVRDSK